MKKREKALQAINLDSSKRREILDDLSGHIGRLAATISTQAKRINGGTFAESQLDMNLLTLALRDLTRCAVLLQDLGCDVGEALARFDGLALDHKNARDVLTHFDDYIVGAGELQTALGELATFSYERGGPEGNAILRVFNPNLSVNLTVAARGADDLALALLEVIERASPI